MRRLLICGVLLLSCGAIINVAVAWGCALWSAQEAWGGERAIEVPTAWPAYLERLNWPTPNSATERLGMDVAGASAGVSVVVIAGGDVDATWQRTGQDIEKTFVSLEQRRFGIPLRAIQWETHGVRAGPRGLEMAKAAAAAAGWRTGIDVSEHIGALRDARMRCLPLMPISPGFAINTVFYAVILWLLFAGPFVLRRRWRIRRGLCPGCAYPRAAGTSKVCTECGAAVGGNRPEKPVDHAA